MNFVRLPVVAVLVLGASSFARAQEEDGTTPLQGQWEVTKAFKRGEEVPVDEPVMSFRFSGEKLFFFSRDGLRSFSFKLDQKKVPREIDLTALQGNFKGMMLPGIFQLEAETLTVCLPRDRNRQRPEAFQSLGPNKEPRMLFHMKRVPSENPRRDALAMQLSLDLAKALRASKVDDALKLIDLPYFAGDDGVIKEAKVLREPLTQAAKMMERANKDEVVNDCAAFWSYPQFRQKFKVEVEKDKNISKQLDEFKLASSDRVVLVHDLGLVLIRFREGNAKVVGIVR